MRKRWRRGQGFGVSGLYPVLVLLMIHKGYSHGYEIKRKIEEITGIPMPEGFIYVTLNRLEASGMIMSHPVLSDPRGKKVYMLTPLGLQFLTARIAELRGLRSLIDKIVDMFGG